MTTLGNYKLIKQIGEGGFARTYLAKHLLLGKSVCIKQNLDLDEEDEKLLFKEAALLFDIHHYCLPTLKDFLRCDDGSHAMVMSFISGKDLWKIVEEDYPDGIDPEHVCWMAQRLLNALHYLHYHGVIHGDVKPQNVMIKPDYEHLAVLVDYGLATIRPKKLTSCPGYTPAFAAPEQLAGKPPIPETDLYGLGLTMLHALGGNYSAKTIPDSVPKPIQEFVFKLIRHDVRKRPETAQELIKPLSRIREKVFGSKTSKKPFEYSK